ncbi:transposase [Candidatus Poribacteria bacterium]|nr:transposase [Candidatus Poribacteria bacterium]
MELSDKEWALIEPELPLLPSGIRGRPWRNNREVLEGIIWILRTGAPWRDLPAKYPPYQTCHRRFQLWSCDGTLEKVLVPITEKLEKRRQLNMSECCIDGKFVEAKKGVLV